MGAVSGSNNAEDALAIPASNSVVLGPPSHPSMGLGARGRSYLPHPHWTYGWSCHCPSESRSAPVKVKPQSWMGAQSKCTGASALPAEAERFNASAS